MPSVAERVRRFIIDDLGWDGAADELTDDLALTHAGVLDSIGILTLVQFLESNYEIVIYDSEIVSLHLGSLASIERFVQAKKSSESPRSPEFSRL
jgi:acyl carrier protein